MLYFMDISKYYNIIVEKLMEWTEQLVEMLPNFVLAVIVLIIFVFAAKLIKKVSENVLNRTLNNRSLSSLVARVIYIIVITIGAFVALGLLNLDKTVTSLLAGAGIIGLALGFAFQDIAIEAVKNTPNIYTGKDIDLVYLGFGDSSIDFRIMIWVEFKSQLDFLKSQSEAIIAIKKAFDREDVMIPFPIRTLDFGIKGGEKLNEVLPERKPN